MREVRSTRTPARSSAEAMTELARATDRTCSYTLTAPCWINPRVRPSLPSRSRARAARSTSSNADPSQHSSLISASVMPPPFRPAISRASSIHPISRIHAIVPANHKAEYRANQNATFYTHGYKNFVPAPSIRARHMRPTHRRLTHRRLTHRRITEKPARVQSPLR